MKNLFFTALIVIFLSHISFANPIFSTKLNNNKDIELKEKIAQMIIVGFNGTNLTDINPIYSDITNLKIGGVILFSINVDKNQPQNEKNIKNYSQLRKLTHDLQKISSTPLFIAIDQEGGNVARLNPNDFNVSKFSAKELGVKNDINFTYAESLKTAKTLNELGINLNFAPCVDLEINKNSKIIATKQRSFSADPKTVTNHARAVIKAHNNFNVLPVLKHFPGHGSATGDTHEGLVDITQTYSELELLPYKILINEQDTKGVLTAHVFNKKIDEIYPISLSSNWIKKQLIHKLKFKDIIFTDDIQMGALKNNYTEEEIIKRAVIAGNDVVIIGNNLNYDPNSAQKFIETIFNAVKAGEISEQRINQSYKKIMNYKNKKLKI